MEYRVIFIFVIALAFGFVAILAARKVPKEMKANKAEKLRIRVFIFLFYACLVGILMGVAQ